jgi:hypothetical protein
MKLGGVAVWPNGSGNLRNSVSTSGLNKMDWNVFSGQGNADICGRKEFSMTRRNSRRGIGANHEVFKYRSHNDVHGVLPGIGWVFNSSAAGADICVGGLESGPVR